MGKLTQGFVTKSTSWFESGSQVQKKLRTKSHNLLWNQRFNFVANEYG